MFWYTFDIIVIAINLFYITKKLHHFTHDFDLTPISSLDQSEPLLPHQYIGLLVENININLGNSFIESYYGLLVLNKQLWSSCSAVRVQKAEANSSCSLEVVIQMLGLWATGRALRGESQALHKTKSLQTGTGLARRGPEQLECNWQGPVVWPLEASQKKSKQGISIYPSRRPGGWEHLCPLPGT